MESKIIVNAENFETRVAITENGVLAEFFIERETEKSIVGNIYKGIIKKVLPGMQAAFVDIGINRAGFLHANDICPIIELENEDKEELEDFDENDLLDLYGNEDEFDNYTPKRTDQKFKKKRKKNSSKIEHLIKEGQEILVQVSREPFGTKGPRLTNYISLPGYYVVFMPTVNQIGISRRIENISERQRLKKLIKENKKKGSGYIIRTASENVLEEDLNANILFLNTLWDNILSENKIVSAPGVVHENLSILQRTIRDFFNSQIDSMIIDSDSDYERCKGFLSQYYNHLLPKLIKYQDGKPIFDFYGIEHQVDRMLDQRVWLKSGGFLVIDQTEALTTIDVNTGRFVGKRNPEETIIQTNLEAVHEVVAQLRLRNIGGIIIVDFIDMEKEKNKNKVYNAFNEELKKDRSRTSILKISDIGLVEMTRKRVRDNIQKTLCEGCPYCEGRGHVKSTTTICYDILRDIKRINHGNTDIKTIKLTTHPEVAGRLLEEDKIHLDDIENKLQLELVIKTDDELHLEAYEIEAL